VYVRGTDPRSPTLDVQIDAMIMMGTQRLRRELAWEMKEGYYRMHDLDHIVHMLPQYRPWTPSL